MVINRFTADFGHAFRLRFGWLTRDATGAETYSWGRRQQNSVVVFQMDETVKDDVVARHCTIHQILGSDSQGCHRVHLTHDDRDVGAALINDVTLIAHGLNDELGAGSEAPWRSDVLHDQS